MIFYEFQLGKADGDRMTERNSQKEGKKRILIFIKDINNYAGTTLVQPTGTTFSCIKAQ